MKRHIVDTVRRLVGTPSIMGALSSLERAIYGLKENTGSASPPSLIGSTFDTRKVIAESFLSGNGIEIGAFASPLQVPAKAVVRYVDKYDLDSLDATHKVAGLTLKDFGVDLSTVVKPDIVDDGECLSKVGDYSQDFVIANHVLEHFEDPIKGFKNMLRVLKHGGILYLCLPDMRHSFDSGRLPTPFEHLLRDYQEGPAWSRTMAYAEFSRIFAAHGMDKGFFPKRTGADLAEFEKQTADELDKADFSIHFHAWTMDSMMGMFAQIKTMFHMAFETKMVMKNNDEVIFIFQKSIPHVAL